MPTIIVSGFAQEDGASLSLLRPLTRDILAKPFDPSRLLRAIDTITDPA